MNLNNLIEQYYELKKVVDENNKVLDSQNKEIKKLMKELELENYETDNCKAYYTIQKRESLNEDKLLNIAKRNGLDSIIKTKEYIDIDKLETMLYKGEIKSDIIKEISDCREIKEIPILKVIARKR